ncbi:MAG TPA: aspartate-semialdehyde dehydrogenase [Candidatus Binatia bacterium]|nr:aspartate-semialdehyde dehydrogenase [Candidatus Binatia bacterium]
MGAGHAIALVGATGAAGTTTLRILEERNFPVRSLRAFASARSAGRQVTFRGEAIPVEVASEAPFRGIELAFFSAGSAQSRALAPAAVEAGAIVVDKSSAFRQEPGVPLVVPEVNGDAARRHRGIVASPNCTTVVTVMALKPLHDAARLRRVIASSYQAVSGAGVNGVEELDRQTRAWASGASMDVRHFPHRIAFNVIPQIDRFVEHGYTGEEWKLIAEVRKILDAPELPIAATCVRVPVFTAHSVSVYAETETPLGVERARTLFGAFPGLRLLDDPESGRYPTPLEVEGQDDCVVGRIRPDLGSPAGLHFWVVGDQLRKGAATNAVQIAELLLR